MPYEYAHNPIIEAVFEFAPMNAQLPALAAEDLARTLAPNFGGQRDTVGSGGGIEIEATPQGQRARALPMGPARHRMWSPDRARLVQFGLDMFVFNALPPYTHYSAYLPQIREAFDAYRAAARPTTVAYLGQRYINRITLPSPDVLPRSIFRVYPEIHEAGEHLRHPQFYLQVQAEEIQRGQVVLSLMYQGPDEERRPTYLLDLYARSVDAPGIEFTWERVAAWHERAHVAISRTFEFALTRDGYNILGRRELPSEDG